ncbi:MAG: hypothetical protein GY862_31825, partial [Gammaproteobacteria bacterium]|nr:hypothetical protein [Gammaproteobacteria bacterium]
MLNAKQFFRQGLLLAILSFGWIVHAQAEFIITTVAGNGVQGFAGDGGPAIAAKIQKPYGLTVDANGNLYIADSQNNLLRKVDTNGIIDTIAGGGTMEPDEVDYDISAMMARFVGVGSVAIDRIGNLYITDIFNHRIRKIALDEEGYISADSVVTTVAGSGPTYDDNDNGDFSGDGDLAIAARLNTPSWITFDNMGNLYIADYYNHRIRRVDVDSQGDISDASIITTIAGTGPVGEHNGGYGGDGESAEGARFNLPAGIAIDSKGNLYIADRSNHRIRKIIADSNGNISGGSHIVTVAGNGTPGYSGDGNSAKLAQLNNPLDIEIDDADNLYLAQSNNNVIRKIAVDASGDISGDSIITTIAGTGTRGSGGDGGLATQAQLGYPQGLGINGAGDTMYISDYFSYKIRKLSLCQFSIDPQNQVYDAGADNGSVNITASNEQCFRGAASHDPWLIITSGSHGTGNDVLTYSVDANTGSSSREGSITIAGQTFTATQNGIAGFSLTVSKNGTGTGTITGPGIDCGDDCTEEYDAGTEVTLVAVAEAGSAFAGWSGACSGTEACLISMNQTQDVTATFDHQCIYALDPDEGRHDANAGIYSVTLISSDTQCPAEAESNDLPWLKVLPKNDTTGINEFSYSVEANDNQLPRIGSLTIAGHFYPVTQEGMQPSPSCAYTISPASRGHDANTGNGTVTVTASNAECAWEAISNDDWVTVTSSNNDSGTVEYSLDANSGANGRVGSLSIAGQLFVINQDSGLCTYTIDPSSRTHEAGGGDGSVIVQASKTECLNAWIAESNASWLTVTSGAGGNGSGTVSYSVAAGNSTDSRNASLTIAGLSFSVNQAGIEECTYTIDPASRNHEAGGGSGSVTVNASKAQCP